MITKPLMMGPSPQSQDYSGFIRQSMGVNSEDPAVFVQALQMEAAGSQRSNTPSLDRIGMPGAQIDPLAGKELGLNGFVEINGKRALALDSGSLATLQDLSRGGGLRNRGNSRTSRNRIQSFDGSLGSLSARFESGERGSSAVGYDFNGGTSYGKYQISSRQGTFEQFLKFLDKEEPKMAATLRAAGQSNTGGKSGAVPDVWRKLAADNPDRLEELEEAFIRRSHFDPAVSEVRKLLGQGELSEPMREVVWSTAVQHGPAGAGHIFEQAYAKLPQTAKNPLDEGALIENVYLERSTKFGSSAPAVREAVLGRFATEKAEALALAAQDDSRVG